MELDGKPIAPPDNVKGTMASIFQDLGEIPEDYLYAAGDGAYLAEAIGAQNVEDVWKGTYHEEGAFLYNEWDYERQHYRKNWAVLRELEVSPADDSFVRDTLQKYRGLTAHLRRTFEALRGEDKLLKKQPYGDNVDIDALVEACADSTMGMEMTERLFTKMHKLERDIAVMFMVDMSGSTKGWINDAERESLVLLCESLETLGDRYAIYGFSGMTRKRCEVYRVKRFDEAYTDEVRGRISRHPPQGLHAHGRDHPSPVPPAERGRGAHQAADHAVRRQAGRLRYLPRRLRHRGHAPGADRGQAHRHPLLLHHHRQRGARLPAAHVRRGELCRHRRGAQAAAQGVGYLPAADDLTTIVRARLPVPKSSRTTSAPAGASIGGV